MKKIILLCLLLCNTLVQAQQTQSYSIDSILAKDFNYKANNILQTLLSRTSDTSKHQRIYKQHNRWKSFWEKRLPNNYLTLDSSYYVYNKAITYNLSSIGTQCLGPTGGNWNYLGPKNDYYGKTGYLIHHVGRIVSLWVDNLNPQYILAGSGAGGLFKTVDSGKNWFNITDNYSHIVPTTMGITNIAVKPDNKNIIFLSLGMDKSAILPLSEVLYRGYGMGLVYSYDGGNTWVYDQEYKNKLNQMQIPENEQHQKNLKLAFSKTTNYLYVLYKGKVLRRKTFGNGSEWQNITPTNLIDGADPLHWLLDFDFDGSGNIFFSTNCIGYRTSLIRYNELNNTWGQEIEFDDLGTNIEISQQGTDFAADIEGGIQNIAVINSNELYLRVRLKPTLTQDYKHKLYKYKVNTDELQLISSTLGDGARQIIVSPTNPNRLYMNYSDGYAPSMKRLEYINGVLHTYNADDTYADGRAMLLFSAEDSDNGKKDVIYSGNDGGISYKAADTLKFMSISGKGLHVAEGTQFSSSNTRSKLMALSAWDQHVQIINPVNYETETIVEAGDGVAVKFAQHGELSNVGFYWLGATRKMKFNANNNQLQQVSAHGSKDKEVTSSAAKTIVPLHYDKDNNLLIGYTSIWKKGLEETVTAAVLRYPPSGSQNYVNEPKGYLNPDDITTIGDRHNKKYIYNFLISEKNPQIAYIVYGGANYMYNNPPYTPEEIIDKGKLFLLTTVGLLGVISRQIWVPGVIIMPLTILPLTPLNPNKYGYVLAI